jgi:hypothetical protein
MAKIENQDNVLPLIFITFNIDGYPLITENYSYAGYRPDPGNC